LRELPDEGPLADPELPFERRKTITRIGACLGFDTRGFAAWLLTRPPGWQIRASALPHLLKSRSRHVGRDLARRFLRELERAGYLTRTRHRTADGRWISDNAFRPNSVLRPGWIVVDDSAAGDSYPVRRSQIS
jgi:hypothetical protein